MSTTTQSVPNNAGLQTDDNNVNTASPATHYSSCNGSPEEATFVDRNRNSPHSSHISPMDTFPPDSSQRDADGMSRKRLKIMEEKINFKFGPYIPIVRKDNSVFLSTKGVDKSYPNKSSISRDVMPNDAILEAPSLVTPMLIKKHTIWPPAINDLQTSTTTSDDRVRDVLPCESAEEQGENMSDDVEIVRVVKPRVDDSDRRTQSNNNVLQDYIRKTAIASLTKASKFTQNNSILTIDNYFGSSVGEMLIGIGLSRVKENTLANEMRQVTRKVRRQSENYGQLVSELESIRSQLRQTTEANKCYSSKKLIECPHCPFKSEFATVMSGHLERPHQNKKREFLCNWCNYKIRDFSLMSFHFLTEHKQRCQSTAPIPLHICHLCSFECKSKRKLMSHLMRCEPNFPTDTFLGPSDYGVEDYPAITSKLITKDDLRTYEDTLKEIRLASYNSNMLRLPSNQQPIYVMPQHNGPILSNSGSKTKDHNQFKSNSITESPGSAVGMVRNCLQKPNETDSQSADRPTQLLNLLSQKAPQMSCSSSQNQPFTNGKLVTSNVSNVIYQARTKNQTNLSRALTPIAESPQFYLAKGDSVNGMAPPNPKGATFVICEICDCYIKDLSQLKFHMQLFHKVRIHKKTLESRPPLNCQKCQWRFFTDQGLERHLLGAHGLVTSNMQDQVEKGIDSGRCTVCGKAFSSKLVAHIKEVHASNLKPAHLSYKCTVCSATFNLYRIFENHVYSVHSDSVKRPTNN